VTAAHGRRLAALGVVALLAGCASGPSQEQRIADAIIANDTVADYGAEVAARIREVFPDLDLTTGLDDPPHTGRWTACSDEPYSDRYDSPDGSVWLNGDVYTIEPRQPTKPLIEPLAQSYVEDGWTVVSDDLDDLVPGMSLRKEGFRLRIGGLTQDHLDQFPEAGGRLTITFYSPCLYSPDNLTEWDPEHPHDFDLAPPEDP
jgi:hypothetical protein